MAKNTLFDGDAYWNDSWVQDLDGDEERLYHFYITSPNLDKSGVYKQTERSVEFYVHGLGLERIREITEKFAKAKKVIRCGEWIIVPTSLKHQNYRNNAKVVSSITEYLKTIPDEVFEELRKCDYPLDLDAIIPPKKVKTDDPSSSIDDLSSKTDDLSMTYPCVIDDLPLKTDEFNLIQSNLIESNINLIGNCNENPESPICEQPVNNSDQKPPPNLYKFIKEKVKTVGYYIDEPVARKIANTIPNQAWFTQNHSIVDFVAKKISDIYSEKPDAERRKLFISALISWENIQDEYPDWLATQNKADELRALERLKNTPPKVCPHCGAEMNGQKCPQCKGFVEFNGEKKEWEYQEHFNFENFHNRHNSPVETESTEPENQEDDIDF
jgi:hypothetical protein